MCFCYKWNDVKVDKAGEEKEAGRGVGGYFNNNLCDHFVILSKDQCKNQEKQQWKAMTMISGDNNNRLQIICVMSHFH